jgi:CheY-like chemotaxis protein
VPAAALSAHVRAEERARALLAGFDVHLAKPIEPAALARAVRNLADRRRV